MIDQNNTAPDELLVEREVRPLNTPTRLLSYTAGVNPDRLEDCPSDDRQAAVRSGLAAVFTWAYVTMSAFAALMLGLGTSALAIGVSIVAAALIGSTIALIDHSIIQAHWFQLGADHARERGFVASEAGFWTTTMKVITGVFRIVFSLVLAFFLATFLNLYLFQADIEKVSRDMSQAANHAAFERAAARADAEIAAQERELERLRRAMKDGAADNDKRTEEFSRRVDIEAAELGRLLDQQQKLKDEAAEHRKDATAEEFGTRDKPSQSGVPGKKNRYFAAMEGARLADERAGELQPRIDELKANIEMTKNLGVKGETPEQISLRNRYAETMARRQALVDNRDASIKAAVIDSPEYKKSSEGIVARLHAMEEIKKDPAIWWFTWGMKAFMMLIEMGAVIVKFVYVAPHNYAIKTVQEFEAMASTDLADAEVTLASSAARSTAAYERRMAVRDRREGLSRRRSKRLSPTPSSTTLPGELGGDSASSSS